MDEMHDDRLADLVDEQIRYLRGEGPPADLSGLTEDERVEVSRTLDLVEALADSLPSSPPIDQDPVAVKLGLVASAVTSASAVGEADPVVVSVAEVSYRFGGAVQVEAASAPTLDSSGPRPVLLCKSLVEVVLVVAYDATGEIATAADARPIFHDNPELSAVAFTSTDALQAAVVPYSETVDRLVPILGWRAPGALEWEPLGIALGRYFDRSMPRWDDVSSLPTGELLEDVASEARASVDAERSRVAGTRPHLPHKRHAKEFVTALEADQFVGWVDAVRARRADGDDLVSQVSELCRAASS